MKGAVTTVLNFDRGMQIFLDETTKPSDSRKQFVLEFTCGPPSLTSEQPNVNTTEYRGFGSATDACKWPGWLVQPTT